MCVRLYNAAKKKRHGKPEREYLKLILITKPPFDYQHDTVTNRILDDCPDIETLSDFICQYGRPIKNNHLWEARERNKKHCPSVEEGNRAFFAEFWHGIKQ